MDIARRVYSMPQRWEMWERNGQNQAEVKNAKDDDRDQGDDANVAKDVLD